jgi:hypothetical protein
MSETSTPYTIDVTATTTQPIGAIQHARPTVCPTLREYLLEQERDMIRRLQRIRDLLAQLPRE